MTRVATQQEVIDLFANLFTPPQVEVQPGGNAVQATYKQQTITLQRASSQPLRTSTHSYR